MLRVMFHNFVVHFHCVLWHTYLLRVRPLYLMLKMFLIWGHRISQRKKVQKWILQKICTLDIGEQVLNLQISEKVSGIQELAFVEESHHQLKEVIQWIFTDSWHFIENLPNIEGDFFFAIPWVIDQRDPWVLRLLSHCMFAFFHEACDFIFHLVIANDNIQGLWSVR